MSTEISDTTIKELIAKPENRIKLHDLVDNETEKLLVEIQAFEIAQGEGALDSVKKWIKEIEDKSATLIKIFSYGCYFGAHEHAYLWRKSLERLASGRESDGIKHKLQLYPVLLLMYAGGMSAIAARNNSSLLSLLSSRISYEHREKTILMGYEVNGWLLSAEEGNKFFELENRKTPLSDHVLDTLNAINPKSLLRETALEATYDKWDILLCMAVAFDTKDERGHQWSPTGRFSWTRLGQIDTIKAELESEGSSWPPIALGMFNKDIDEAKAALEFVQEVANSRF